MNADAPPTFIRCKDAIIDLGSVAMILKFNGPPTGPPVIRSAIEIRLKSGSNTFIDYSQDDEACSAEPRDRAFEDIWRALTRKVPA